MDKRTRNALSAVNDLIEKSVQVSPGPPARYCLQTTRSNLDQDGKIRKWTFGQKYANMQNKVILMVGETGTGKTTLINIMVNYYLGVKFDDNAWFEITEEGNERDQTQSQTSEVTVYEIFSDEKTFSLTIIDTPGYGNTRGIDKDIEIAQNLHKLFLHDSAVKDLDAVCLLLKASQNRISEMQLYIFEAVLSLFGKDIEDNIVLCITHSDGGPSTNLLEAIKKAKIPCCHDEENEPVHFAFNNQQSERRIKKYEHVFRSYWQMGENSTEDFFEFLKSQTRKSLNMTVEVLEDRVQLEACVQSLRESIKFMEAKHNELTVTQKTLEKNKENIEKDDNFPLTITTTYKEKEQIIDALWWDQYATSCDHCEENCHEYGCLTAPNVWWCEVMKNDYCTVCKCHYTKHVREARKYVTKQKVEQVTFNVLKQKYANSKNISYDENAFIHLKTDHEKQLQKKEDMNHLVSRLKAELAENKQLRNSTVREAYLIIVKLSANALKTDSAFTIQHLDFLIPRVEEIGKQWWAQKLKDMQEAAKADQSTNAVVGFVSKMMKKVSGK